MSFRLEQPYAPVILFLMPRMPVQHARGTFLLSFRILPTSDGKRLPKTCSSQPVVSLGLNRVSCEKFSAGQQIKVGYTCIKHRFWTGTISVSDLWAWS